MRRVLVALIVASLPLTGCGYRGLMQRDEQVRAAWSDVASELQQRTDLVPALIGATQVLTTREHAAVQALLEAQAKAVSIQRTPELSDNPAAIAKLESTEAELSRALGTLIASARHYRELEADPAFRDLLAQLSAAELHVTQAIGQYTDCVERYNADRLRFPASLTARLFDLRAKPSLSGAGEVPAWVEPADAMVTHRSALQPAAGAPTVAASGPPR